MMILAEPLAPAPATSYHHRYRELLEAGQGCTEAVVLSADLGVPPACRYLFAADGQLLAQLAPGEVPGRVVEQLVPLERRPGPYVVKGVSYLPVLPRITLLIVGGGHVGLAVAKLAAEVDFDVWVADDREKYVNIERFPMARRILIGDIGQTLKGLANQINASTYCIIVTRGHAHDEEALYHLAATRAGYLGLIGSKRKIKMIYEDLLAKQIPEEALRRVHAPLGLHIGSQTVAEIAVSIVAELIAQRNLGQTGPTHSHKDLLGFFS
jgi:xanthine dehydrogenase accessory factor